MSVALAIVFAGVLHASWNALAKGSSDPYAAAAQMGVAQAVIVLPLLPVLAAPERASWPWLAASATLHVGYLALLMKSYELGDFSQVYPLARGTAPLLVALVATLALGERLSLAQLAGVAAVCGGLAILAFAGGGARRPENPRAIAAALLAGVSIAAYTVVDGVGVRRSGGSAGYALWLFLLMGTTVAAWIGARRPAALRSSRWTPGLAGGAISMLSYGIILWAQTRGTMAEVAALRETGVIAGAVIGAVCFAERMGPVRIAAAGVVAAGVVLLTTR
jgi:drug/metabolite transporter (DMT)-like permease